MKRTVLILGLSLITIHVFYGQIMDKSISTMTSAVQENRCQCGELLIEASQEGVFYSVFNTLDELTAGPFKGTGNNLLINTGPTLIPTEYHIVAETYEKSLKLNGTTNYIETREMIPYSAKFSIVANIKFSNSSGIIYAWTSDYSKNYGSFEVYQGKLRYATGDGNNLEYIDSPTSLTANTWIQVAASFNGSEMYLYVNGALVKALAVNCKPTPDRTTIGSGFVNGLLQNFYKGNIDDLSVWDINLTPAQIFNLQSTNPVGNEANLVAFYDFENLPDTILINHASETLYKGDLNHIGSNSYEIDNVTETKALNGTHLIETNSNNVITNEDFEYCPGEEVTVNISETNNNYGYFLFDKNQELAVEDTVSSYDNQINLITPVQISDQSYEVIMTQTNQSLNFDGTDDYIDITPMIPLTDSMTIMARIKTTGNGAIFNWGQDGVNKFATFEVYFGHLRLTTCTSSQTKVYIDGNISVNDDSWHNVAVTFGSKQASLYVDGILDITDNFVDLPVPVKSTIGGAYVNNLWASYYPGAIDDLSIWDRVLSINEINCYFSLNPWGNDEGLLAFYNFNSLPAELLLNSVEGNYHGTFVNIESISVNQPESITDSTLEQRVVTALGSNCETNDQDISQDELIQVYPIPTENYLKIKIDKSVKDADIIIVDSSGAVVNRFKYSDISDGNLDLSDLVSGIYFIKISTDELIQTQKLVKK